MADSPFPIPFSHLPGNLPLFPLDGALLLPGGQLPLRIFEPRYIALVNQTLRHKRLIGIVQPRDAEEGTGGDPDLYRIGCAGRISAFEEADDGTYEITLTGMCRFHLRDDSTSDGGFRIGDADYSLFEADMARPSEAALRPVAPGFMDALRSYFEQLGYDADFDAMANVGALQLVNSLSMICPFDSAEKQALLEADTLGSRTDLLMNLMAIAAAEGPDSPQELN